MDYNVVTPSGDPSRVDENRRVEIRNEIAAIRGRLFAPALAIAAEIALTLSEEHPARMALMTGLGAAHDLEVELASLNGAEPPPRPEYLP